MAAEGWYVLMLMFEVVLDHEMKCNNEIQFGNSFFILPSVLHMTDRYIGALTFVPMHHNQEFLNNLENV